MTSACGFVLAQVTVTHGPARLLDAISAHIPTGQCTAVVGPSGAGKSTLLRLLNRLDDPTTGHIQLDGVPLTDLDVLALRRRVALIAQQPTLLTDHVTDELRVARPELADQELVELLARTALPAAFVQRRTAEISGGEAQRLCLARALALDPEILLLDEPTSALDDLTATAITDLARHHRATGGTVVLVSHDLAVVRDLADQVLVLDHGTLIAAGYTDQVSYLQQAE